MPETSPSDCDASNHHHTKELRIGLVLFGGVSLAVYINGIVTEIWNAVRASRGLADDGGEPGGETTEVYRKLIAELAGKHGAQRLQIVVDTVAGSSAGGVNGTMLAKAIVAGGDARVLNTVWIEKAGIEQLCNLPPPFCFLVRMGIWAVLTVRAMRSGLRSRIRLRSRTSIDPAPEGDNAGGVSPEEGFGTPLDGRYFARMIARTLAEVGEHPSHSLLSMHHRFDLFLTQTDLHGWPRHLAVSRHLHSDTLLERTHAHVMQFGNRDFGPDGNFALTYATRATAGFPLVFAPVGYDAIKASFIRLGRKNAVPGLELFASRHLREHQLAGDGFPPEHAWMIDGGVLDNKPFTHVSQAIERKPAVRQVYRTVVYVDPRLRARSNHRPTSRQRCAPSPAA